MVNPSPPVITVVDGVDKEEDYMRTEEEVLEEINALDGQDDKAAFEKYLEIVSIGIFTDDDSVQLRGYMNAAAIVCNMGKYDIVMQIMEKARAIDEGMWAKYLEEPHMQNMLSILAREGLLN